MVIEPVVDPAGMVIGLDEMVKSAGFDALPLTVKGTVVFRPETADDWAVIVMLPTLSAPL